MLAMFILDTTVTQIVICCSSKKNKKVYIVGDGDCTNTVGVLRAVAYRKLGTGFETITT